MASSYNALSKEETYRLISQAKGGDETAKESLVSLNTGLVKNIALKFTGTGYELDDLLQIGFIGLLKAIERFDINYDVMFSTYAVPMILGEIRRYLRDDGRIKVSRQTKQDIKTMSHLQEQFYNEHGRQPQISELAEMMEKDSESILTLLDAKEALSHLESLDDPDRQERETKESYVETEERQLDLIQLKSMIINLTDKERQIIVLRYFKDMTQQEIAGRIGISQVQVSRIEKKVLAALRREME